MWSIENRWRSLSLENPDAIAREIAPENPESAALAAGRKAIELARSYIQADSSFIVETTLAGNTYLNLMREVKALGWSVSLTYVGIDDPVTNVQRVYSRVKLGGHDVPSSDILRRYERSLVNLGKAAKIVDKLTPDFCKKSGVCPSKLGGCYIVYLA